MNSNNKLDDLSLFNIIDKKKCGSFLYSTIISLIIIGVFILFDNQKVRYYVNNNIFYYIMLYCIIVIAQYTFFKKIYLKKCFNKII